MATTITVVNKVYVQAAYALNAVGSELMASCHRHLWCQCTPSSPCQANALPLKDTVAFWQCFYTLTSDCEPQMLAASYNTAGLLLDDWAVALTCGVQLVSITSLVHPLHIVHGLCPKVWGVWSRGLCCRH